MRFVVVEDADESEEDGGGCGGGEDDEPNNVMGEVALPNDVLLSKVKGRVHREGVGGQAHARYSNTLWKRRLAYKYFVMAWHYF
jgi:hypothetical protein